MKPLPPIGLTKEDWDIWARWIVRNPRLPSSLWPLSIQSDRRDAGFMLLLARIRGVWMSVQDWYGMLEEAGLAGYGQFTVQALRPPLNAIAHKG